MFTDIKIARKSAHILSKTLMVPTVVIAVGPDFAVVTADEVDADDIVLTEFDPFA